MKEKAMHALELLIGRRTAYKAALLFVMLLSAIPWVQYYFSFVFRGFLAWGALIILWDLLHQKKLWEGKTLNILMGFCMFYAVTIFMNRDTELMRNIKSLAYMAVVFITLYGGGAETPENKNKERRILTGELFVMLTGIAASSLVLYLFGIKRRYTLPNGVKGYVGSFANRLTGLFNSNTLGALCVILIIINLGLLFGKKNKKAFEKVLYGTSLFMAFVCLFLTFSRTAVYALAAVLGLAVFWLLPRGVKSFGTASYRTVMTARVTLALIVILVITEAASPAYNALTKLNGVFAAKEQTKKKSSSTKKKSTSETKAAETKADTAKAATTEASETSTAKTKAASTKAAETKAAETKAAEAEATASDVIDDALSGRLSIWKAGLKAWRENAVFGITNEAIPERLYDLLDGSGWGVHVKSGGVHNIYLEVLVASGTAGAVCIVLFVIVCFIMIIVRKKSWIKNSTPAFTVLLLLICFFSVAELMESRILYKMGFFMVFFWMAAGMLKEDIMGMEIDKEKDAEPKKRLLSQTDI